MITDILHCFNCKRMTAHWIWANKEAIETLVECWACKGMLKRNAEDLAKKLGFESADDLFPGNVKEFNKQ